jgi:PAS domain S-box-containing protein
MTKPARITAARYAAAILASAVAVALLGWLHLWLGSQASFVVLLGAVAYSAWYGGFGPAMLAAAIGALAIEVWFPGARPETTAPLLFHGAYFAVCALISLLGRQARLQTIIAGRGALRQQQMIDALPMLISYLDAGGVYRLNNRAYELWLGQDRSQITGRHIRDVMGEANWTEILPRIERVLAGETVRYETLVDYPRLGRREVSVTCIPHREGGVIQGFFAVVEDISERTRAELARAHLAAVVASSDDAIVSCTLDGLVTSWNAGAQRLYGYDASEMAGVSIERLLPSDLRDVEMAILGRLAKGERFAHLETEHLARDARRMPVSVTLSPIHDAHGDVIGVSRITRDISASKAVERALRDSEARFRSLVDHAPMLVWRTDAAHQAVWFNQCWLDFTGRSLEQDRGDGWVELIHPDDRARVSGLCTERQAQRERFETEFRLRRHDGEYRWMFDRGVPIHDGADAGFSGFLGSCIDITERREAEQELNRTLESIGDGFFALDAQWRCVHFNAKAERLLRMSREDVLGRNFWEAFPLLCGTVVEREYRHCARGEIRDFEHFHAPQGRWHHSSCSPRDGGGITVYIRDVTEDKLTRRALHESEAKFRIAFANTPNVLAISSMEDERFLEVNQAFEYLTGHLREQAVGRTSEELGLWSGFVQRGMIVAQLGTGQSIREVELILRRRDGSLRTVLLSADRITLDGKPCIISSWLDITRHRELEAQLRVTVNALAEGDRRKNEFLAILAHELRNPLAPILSAAQYMQLMAPQDPMLLRGCHIIERQALHMSRLVDDLLDLARVSRGQVKLKRAPMSLQQAIDSAVEASLPQLESAKHHFELAFPDHDVIVDGDLMRLSQVIGNLLANAIKYTPPGGSIRIGLCVVDGRAEVRVRDSGIGIQPNMQERIFDMFTQDESALDRSRGGLGIGLTLARQLIGMHDGSITASSAGPGTGSEFVMRLPLAATSADAPVPPMELSPCAAPPSRSLDVLLADDNEDAATSLALLLELHGHRVRIVHDGAEAVRAAGESMPDAVLLDIGMPAMDGYEAARRIRALPTATGVRLIALTGWGQERDRQRAEAAGFDMHFTKPVAFTVLQEALTAAPLETN